MSSGFLIAGGTVVNEGAERAADVRVRDKRIDAVGDLTARAGEKVINADGMYVFPGLIDDQVHFRQPGLTHKADIRSESRAAVAGGITSYMEMPNVIPPTLTMTRIEEKRDIAARDSLANYAFYLGASNDNLDDIKGADARRIAGVKIFMGASTGNMLVDDEAILTQIFANAPCIIATHCENSKRIAARMATAQAQFGDDIPPAQHAVIRDAQSCFESSQLAVNLARQTGARLHILHITTARELELFAAGDHMTKQITAEACAHHLIFCDEDYARLGHLLKCNPAVKTAADRAAVRAAVAARRIDVLATDHAPHLPGEKRGAYARAAAGLPLAEYALPAFLELVAAGVLTRAAVAAAAAHRVADIFATRDRGYVREGYFADLVLVERKRTAARARVLAKCGWTPFADRVFDYRVARTFVNGACVWDGDNVIEAGAGMAIEFDR